MIALPKSIDTLITEIQKLPSIGHRTAQRLAFYLIKQPEFARQQFSKSLIHAHEYSKCEKCFCLSESSECPVCNDDKRKRNVICVVEEFLDLFAIDQSGGFKGLYHVLEGVLSPIDGVFASDIRMNELFDRLDGVEEIIVATNTTMEGEATAMYIKEKMLENNAHIEVTRIARGLPMGADLEFADSITLMSAFEGRRKI